MTDIGISKSMQGILNKFMLYQDAKQNILLRVLMSMGLFCMNFILFYQIYYIYINSSYAYYINNLWPHDDG
jgi:hypothetical protein